MFKHLWLILVAACWMSGAPRDATAAADATAATASAASRCRALESADFSGIQDAPTRIVSVRFVDTFRTIPNHCRVEGYIAPQVGFELRLPASDWNGKLIVLGIGGWGGSVVGDFCVPYQRLGYACIVTDTGHKARTTDILWAANNLAAQVDIAYRAVHVTTLAAKSLVASYYSQAARRAYFMGCSGGGRQGLIEAQRFPWDFDGIVAGAPVTEVGDWAMRVAWAARTIVNAQGQPILPRDDLQLLHRAVLAACDKDDGVEDGIVGNAVGCRFDPAKLTCKREKTASCLEPAQVEAVRRIYAGPTTSTGQRTSTGGVLLGAEMLWSEPVVGLATPVGMADAVLKYPLYGASPGWQASSFDFDHDHERLGLGAIYSASNPDLRKFKSAGGKLIAYQGTHDLSQTAADILDYYRVTERAMGGRAATRDFFRLFMVPGMAHCTGGEGAYAIDYLSYLEAWVEQGKAPDVMIGAHVSDTYLADMPIVKTMPDASPRIKAAAAASTVTFPLDPAMPIAFTRPVYPYPLYAKYTGRGDVNQAASFVPIDPG